MCAQLKGSIVPTAQHKGAKPSYPVATLGLQFGVSENKGCVCEKEGAHVSHLHGAVPWSCVGVREGELNAF